LTHDARLLLDVDRDELVAAAGLAIDEDLAPAKLGHRAERCKRVSRVATHADAPSMKTSSTAGGQTSCPSLPLPRFSGDAGVVGVAGEK